MATKSGMNYDKVQNLISELQTKKEALIANLEELSSTAPAQIAEHYSGEAANTFKATLTKVITNVSETLDTMVTQLRTNTEQKQADYTAQDQKMQDSVNTGNVSA